jgi:hypothetical protein
MVGPGSGAGGPRRKPGLRRAGPRACAAVRRQHRDSAHDEALARIVVDRNVGEIALI